MRATRSLPLLLLLVAFTPIVAAAQNPQETFDSLFGAEARRVQATADKKDDVAFARKLISSAQSLSEDPALQALLYNKAYEFALADSSGFDAAQKAMTELASTQPKLKEACDEKLLALLERQFHIAAGRGRKTAASAYLDKLEEIAGAKSDAGQLEESVALHRQGLTAASAVGPDKRAELLARLTALDARIATQHRIADLSAKLKANPGDHALASALVLALLLEADDPAQAAQSASAADDPQLQHISTLAVREVSELKESEALELGDWYKSHTLGPAKSIATLHARLCYQQFLAVYPKEDARRLKAKLALDQLGPAPDKASATAASAPRRINLMPLIDVEKDALEGTWRRDRNDLLLESGVHYSPLRIGYQAPEEFDFHVEFTRTEGKETVGLLWSSAAGPMRWDICRAPTVLENGRRYSAVLRVRKGSITGLLDGKLVAQFKPDAPEIAVDAPTSVGPGALGIASLGQRSIRFHQIELIEVTGNGHVGAHGDLDPKDWRILLFDAGAGRWADVPLDRIATSVDDGALEARNSTNARAILYYARKPMDATFAASFVWSGGDEICIRPADGKDNAIFHAVTDDKWHSGRWRRTDRGEVGFFVDEQQAQLAGRNDPGGGTKVFCFELAPGHSLRLRHFALSVPRDVAR